MDKATRCILLVEDHEDTAYVAAKLLRHHGYEVVVAGSIKTALTAAAGRHIDMALCDVGLPDGDGYQLMKELHQIYALPCVAMTGFVMGDEEALDRAGVFRRLAKPVDFGDLRRAVEDALVARASSSAVDRDLPRANSPSAVISNWPKLR